MAISESFIQQLRMACDITSIVSSYVELKREGRNKKCLCPFHLEKTPSLVVYEDTQSFYCFGCGTGGDVITFIMKIENLEDVEAVKFLAARVGLTVPEDGQDDKLAKQRSRILALNREAARFFHQSLKSPEGREGLAYFAQRRLTKKTIITYGLGYAPNQWHALLDHIKSKGYSYEEAALADLAVKSKNGRYYDKFRNRVIFPIIDLRGNVIGFGGRVLDDSKPKYLNSSDTPVFKKSRNLFSLNFAKNSPEKTLILADGYMDVIAMYQAGFHNVVATLGTALTAEQARLISRYADDVIIAYDSDEAGQIATTRASNLFEEAGVEARVLEITGAKDPDEYIKTYGADRFKVLLEQSENVIKNKLKRLKSRYNLDEPEEQVKYIHEYCLMISELYDKLERDVYAGSLAVECNLSKAAVLEQVEHLRKQQYRRKKSKEWKEIQSGKAVYVDKINPERVKYPKEAKAEEGILYFLLNHPDFVSYILERIQPEQFITSWNQKLFALIIQKIQQDSPLELTYFNEQLSPDEMGRLARILSENRDLNHTKESLDDYIAVILQHAHKLQDAERSRFSLDDYEQYRQELFKNKGKK